MNHAIVRPTKIMNKADKNWAHFLKNIIFKNIFNKSWSPRPIFFKDIFLESFQQILTLKNDLENQNFEMFEEIVHNFDKSDNDII